MRACECYWNATDSKKNYFRPDYPTTFLDMTVQRNVPRFCTGSICGWNLFQPLGPVCSMINVLRSGPSGASIMNQWFSYIKELNHLSPHDALKHHFTSLKTDLIFLHLGVFEWKFPWNWFIDKWFFSLIRHPLQIIFIHYKSRHAMTVVNSDLKVLNKVFINII